ncbi:MAG: hypothetical protein ACMG6E_04525, partial [Candidatus Roizmanbacteria bacterium]
MATIFDLANETLVFITKLCSPLDQIRFSMTCQRMKYVFSLSKFYEELLAKTFPLYEYKIKDDEVQCRKRYLILLKRANLTGFPKPLTELPPEKQNARLCMQVNLFNFFRLHHFGLDVNFKIPSIISTVLIAVYLYISNVDVTKNEFMLPPTLQRVWNGSFKKLSSTYLARVITMTAAPMIELRGLPKVHSLFTAFASQLYNDLRGNAPPLQTGMNKSEAFVIPPL